MVRYQLTDYEWAAIRATVAEQGATLLGAAIRRTMARSAGLLWPLHNNRFVRWRRAEVWGRIMDALAAAHDAAVQMIDTSIRARASARRHALRQARSELPHVHPARVNKVMAARL